MPLNEFSIWAKCPGGPFRREGCQGCHRLCTIAQVDQPGPVAESDYRRLERPDRQTTALLIEDDAEYSEELVHQKRLS